MAIEGILIAEVKNTKERKRRMRFIIKVTETRKRMGESEQELLEELEVGDGGTNAE